MKTKLSASMTTLAALSLLFGIAISDVQAKSGGHGGSSRSKSNSSSNRSYSSRSNGGHSNNNRSYSNRSNGSNNNYSSNRNSNGHGNSGTKNSGHSNTSGNKSNGHSNGQKYNSQSKNNNNHGQRWNSHYGNGRNSHQRYGWNSWWYNYYAPLQNAGANNNYRYYDGSYVSGDYTTSSGEVVQDVRWYLGLRGLILPGKGLGIEQVEDNSPASLAGLQQGMVITRINGVDMVDEAAMGRVIESSGGTLTMDVLDKLDGQVFSVTVSMRQMAVSSF
jgi:hypothetical protein